MAAKVRGINGVSARDFIRAGVSMHESGLGIAEVLLISATLIYWLTSAKSITASRLISEESTNLIAECVKPHSFS
jgi:hypothetical protein